MKIKTIEAQIKGIRMNVESLPDLGILRNKNRTGKTALALACEVAVTRYCRSVAASPAPANNNKMRALGQEIFAKVMTDQGEASYRLNDQGVEHENNTGLENVLWLDPDEFFGLSPKDRVAYVVAMSKTITAEEAEERLCVGWDDCPGPNDGEGFQDYLTRIVKGQKAVAKDERAALKTLKAQLAGLPPREELGNISADIEALFSRREDNRNKGTALGQSVLDYQKAFDALQGITVELQNAERADSEDEPLPDLVEQDRTIRAVEKKIGDLKSDLEGAREKTRALQLESQEATTQYQAALDWEPDECPHCGKHLVEKPDAKGLEQASAGCWDRARDAQRAENLIKATLSDAEGQGKKLRSERDAMARVVASREKAAGAIEQLRGQVEAQANSLPPEPPQPATQDRIQALEQEHRQIDEEIAGLRAKAEQQNQRTKLEQSIEQAAKLVSEAKKHHEDAQALLSETVATGMENALAPGNVLASQVLGVEFRVTPKGEMELVDHFNDGRVVAHGGWSGAEHLVSQVALSLAVAQQQDRQKSWRVVILDDRIFTLDRENQSRMLNALKHAQESGALDQVMILTPMELAPDDPKALEGWDQIEANLNPLSDE